jgi:hypothetical protein
VVGPASGGIIAPVSGGIIAPVSGGIMGPVSGGIMGPVSGGNMRSRGACVALGQRIRTTPRSPAATPQGPVLRTTT